MIEFKNMSSITAFIALSLCMLLLFSPGVVFWLFNIEGHSSAFFIGRRAAMLFLGVSVLTWMSRNAVHSESRQAICVGLSVSMITLALLGSVEYLRGYAGAGILLAIVTEFTLAFLYFRIWLSHKNV